MTPVLGFYMPGGWEWIIILVIALLIFGKRLPEVGKSLGKGIVEFKKGLKGVKDEMSEIERDVDDAVSREEREQKAKQDPPKLESQSEEVPFGADAPAGEAETRKGRAESEA